MINSEGPPWFKTEKEVTTDKHRMTMKRKFTIYCFNIATQDTNTNYHHFLDEETKSSGLDHKINQGIPAEYTQSCHTLVSIHFITFTLST